MGQVVELTKRFIEAYQKYRDEPRVEQLKNKVLKYNRKLRDLGLKDHQVERATNPQKLRNLLLLIYRSNLLLAWAILALPGTILHSPIFIPAKIYSHRKAKQALAASTVKIAARDVVASWKVLFSLGATPLLYTVYAILATWIAWRQGASITLIKWMPAIVFFIMPFFAMSSLKFGEAGMDVFKSLRPLFVSLLPGSQQELEGIRNEREKLSNQLSELINEFGPQLWEKFHQSRLRPAASVPPTNDPGLLFRNRETGDSSVLSHPMSWLDDRIFGWSRSAVTGPDAWNARPMNQASASSPRAAMTDLSDEEESGGGEEEDVDYDDVLAIIDTKRPKPNGSEARTSAPYKSRTTPSESIPTTSSTAVDMSSEAPETVIDGPDSNTTFQPHMEGQPTRRHARTSTLEHSVDLSELRRLTKQEHNVNFAQLSSELNERGPEQGNGVNGAKDK